MPLRSLMAALAALICLAGADVASAAGINFGTGRFPDAQVDENNTAHVVWDGGTGDETVHYCQVPRTAGDCTNRKTFTLPLESIGRSTYVFTPGGGRVIVASVRCCGAAEGLHVLESTDGGLNFGPARHIGKFNFDQDAVFGPGESISGVTTSTFQNAPLAGPASEARAELDPGFGIPTYGSVAIHNGTTPVFARADGDNTTFHRHNGAGGLNDKASWVGPTAIEPGNEVVMAGGPAGTILQYVRGTPGKNYWAARVFDGTNFGPERRITEVGSPIFAENTASPFGGGFHTVWIDNRSPNSVNWSRSADGADWTAPYEAFADADADNAFNLRIGGAPDGRAFIVWDQNSNTGNAKGMLIPQPGKEEPPVDTQTEAQLEVGLVVPFACVAKPAKARLQVTSKTKKKIAKNKRVRITKVVFSLDGLKKVTDKKAAFRNDFKTDTLANGTAHPASAKVTFVPVKGGKSRTKTLKGTVRICA